jgi:predicted transposase/invertase (TIGR01784 family)
LPEKVNQIFDKAFKRILTLSSPAVVYFFNGLFDENFPLNSKVTYNETETINDKLDRIAADGLLNITAPNEEGKFHVEAQINPDNTISIRVFRYDFEEAVKHNTTDPEDGAVVLTFPKPKVIYLEHYGNTPDEVKLRLNFEGQGTYTYKVPTLKLLDYSVEELTEKHMVSLLPLYLLKYRDEMKKYPTKETADKLRELIGGGILKAIDESRAAGVITPEDARVLIALTDKLYEYIYDEYEVLRQEGVRKLISDRLVLATDIAKKDGVKLGKKHGMKLGKKRGMKLGKKRGMKLGKKLGKKRGKEQAKIEDALGMLRENIPADVIARVTRLPIERILTLHTQDASGRN